jgi:hypothetical protein
MGCVKQAVIIGIAALWVKRRYEKNGFHEEREKTKTAIAGAGN